MKRYSSLPGILLLTLLSGCFYEMRDEFNECKINCSNHMAAKAAWCDAQRACGGICCPHSFKEGFMTGYVDVCNGGTGCLPAVPMINCCNHMWMDFHCSDSDKMEAWYDGYEHGAMAAKAEGMADSNRINTRAPRASTIDYSNMTPSQSPGTMDDMSSEPAIPPAPITDSEDLSPQTRRQSSGIFK